MRLRGTQHPAGWLQQALPTARPFFRGFDPGAVPTPCFVVDRAALRYNLAVLRQTADAGGFRVLAALKAFSCGPVFDLLRDALDGGCASGLYEARLAREELGREVHVFSPAYRAEDLDALLETADHLVFNHLTQWRRFQSRCLQAAHDQAAARAASGRPPLRFGIRINPAHSEGTTPIYDPCAPLSRLGVTRSRWHAEIQEAGAAGCSEAELLEGLSGLHFHTLCEQGAEPLQRTVQAVEAQWGEVLERDTFTWLNLGGGHHITKPDYNRTLLTHETLRLKERYGVTVYLEPGEAVAIHSGVLVARVLDVHENTIPQVILDTSATCHMPDTLEMPYTPEIWGAESGVAPGVAAPGDAGWTARLGGQSCLAGDVIGTYRFAKPLQLGDHIVFDDMAHYTMVKTTTFNGIPLPSIAVYDSDTGECAVVRTFGYEDFRSRLG